MNWRKLVVLSVLLGGAACHRKISVVAPPAGPPAAPPPVVAALPVSPAALRDGESAFESRDFARAARSFESYLQSNPQAEDIDSVLFKYAVAQSLSGVTARETASSDNFNQLIREFPQSVYVPSAQMILSLRADIAGLRANTERIQGDQKTRDDTIRQLTDQLARAQADFVRAQSDKAQMQSDQKGLNDKIKQLNDELDKLKKIDLDRRRTP
jgi:uncharacterized phage infection (PIP) family protein YhgE